MQVRDAHEGDAAGVTELYRAVYGDDFPFQEFYDALWIKKGIFDDDIAWVVAEEGGDLIGSAAVMLNAGDPQYLYGPDAMIAHVISALRRGDRLQKDRLQRLARELADADLAALIDASPPDRVKPEDLEGTQESDAHGAEK